MSNQKNLADVTDKAIDRIADGTAAVAEAFAKLAPEAWHALVMRVQIEAIVTAVLWCIMAACFATVELVAYRKFRQDKIDGETCFFAMAGTALLVGMPTIVCTLTIGAETIGAIFVPEYYAAKEILEAIR